MVSELYLERDQVQVSTLAGSSSHLASGSLTSKSSPLTGHVSVLVYWCIGESEQLSPHKRASNVDTPELFMDPNSV